MYRQRILIVDDDPAITKFVRANLEAEDYQTLLAKDGFEALQVIEKELPDLVILDIIMPRTDGFEVCRQIREWSKVPIIILSARGDENDKVTCLELGADDYLTKPFGIRELMARIKATLRRTELSQTIPTKPSFTTGDFEIDFAARRVTIDDKEVILTRTEYQLLQELVLYRGKVLTHSHLLNKVWGPEYTNERRILQVYISRLRAEIDPDLHHPRYIVTLSGVGYIFKG